MRIVYVSRQFNRSGYHVLDHLVRTGEVEIAAVLVPSLGRHQAQMAWLNRPGLAGLERTRYRLALAWYRGQDLRFEGSIARLARRAGLQVLELPTLRTPEATATLRALDVDLMVLGGGWPELIPADLLAVPPLGAVNTHPSLLPDFRGTDIHRWQVLAGVATTGTTVHYMDEKFDTGGIVGQAAVTLDQTETPQALFDRTARVAGPLMVEVLRRISEAAPARAEAQVQPDRSDASRYYSAWRWDDERLQVNWRDPAERIERLVRASAQESYRYLGAMIAGGGRRFLLRRASVTAPTAARQPGAYALDATGTPVVSTGSPGRAVRLDQVQPYAPVPNRHRAQPGSCLPRQLGADAGYLDLPAPPLTKDDTNAG